MASEFVAMKDENIEIDEPHLQDLEEEEPVPDSSQREPIAAPVESEPVSNSLKKRISSAAATERSAGKAGSSGMLVEPLFVHVKEEAFSDPGEDTEEENFESIRSPKVDKFDAKQLIRAVEVQPAIWDIRSPDYGNKAKKKRAWDEIVNMVVKESTPLSKRKQLGDALMKKWKYLRDHYSREVGKASKIRSGTRRKSSYIYSRQMAFLKDVMGPQPVRKSITLPDNNRGNFPPREGSSPVQGPGNPSQAKPKRSLTKKNLLDPVESWILSSLESFQPRVTDDDEHFLLSLVPTMKTIPTEHKIACRMEVMQVLTKFARYQTNPIECVQLVQGPSQTTTKPPSEHEQPPTVNPPQQSMSTSAHHHSAISFAQPRRSVDSTMQDTSHSSPTPTSQPSPSLSEESNSGEDSNLNGFNCL